MNYDFLAVLNKFGVPFDCTRQKSDGAWLVGIGMSEVAILGTDLSDALSQLARHLEATAEAPAKESAPASELAAAAAALRRSQDERATVSRRAPTMAPLPGPWAVRCPRCGAEPRIRCVATPDEEKRLGSPDVLLGWRFLPRTARTEEAYVHVVRCTE